MQILIRKGGFEYFHIIEKRMIFTDNEIPFIIDLKTGKPEDLINDYLIHKTENAWNPKSKTPLNNASQILSFLNFCIELKINDWTNFNSNDLRKYIHFLTSKGQKETTIKTKVVAIQSLFEWLESFNFINANPFNSFQKREIKRTVNFFSNSLKTTSNNQSRLFNSIASSVDIEDIPTENEIKSFYKQLPKETKLMAHFCIETGVRKSELLQLRIKDIETAKESHTGRSYSVFLNASEIQIKSNKSRNIIISKNLYVKLKKHINSNEYKNKLLKFLNKKEHFKKNESPIFISIRGNYFSEGTLNKSFKKASVESGYQEKHNSAISPHQLRHFYASHFIYKKEQEGEINMEDAYMYLSQRLGHSSVSTTKDFYVKIVNKVKQQKQIEEYSEGFISGFLED